MPLNSLWYKIDNFIKGLCHNYHMVKNTTFEMSKNKEGYGITVKVFSQDPNTYEVSKSFTVRGLNTVNVHELLVDYFKILEKSNNINISYEEE